MSRFTPVQFLRIPPFPKARAAALAAVVPAAQSVGDSELDRLIARVAELKVGGSYWAAQPTLPSSPYALVRVRDPAERSRQIARLKAAGPVLVCNDRDWPSATSSSGADHVVSGPCDPWHLLSGGNEIAVDADNELALVAALCRVPVRPLGEGQFAHLPDRPEMVREAFRTLAAMCWVSPFTGERIGFGEAIEMCGFWRQLIDSNRPIAAAVGFALWKRRTVAPLLWGGSGQVPFASSVRSLRRGETIAVWKSRVGPAALQSIAECGLRAVEVEDGFIRSAGLGAECVPPLSIVVDWSGIYFDPARSSDLEKLLQEATFSAAVLNRAKALRKLIVQARITKYAVGGAAAPAAPKDRRKLLAVGQVEDDRAVFAGGGPKSNLELLERVRSDNPDAWIVYKPHPDVEASQRRGTISDETGLRFADEIARGAAIAPLIEECDEVHVNTSLAGFEALLRGKAVTAYGVPFYAGWGLTRDLGPVPERRTARRSLDELVAAALLLYPRYLDPVTNLPCPPEVLVKRLSVPGSRSRGGGIVQLRRLQGHLNRVFAAIRG